MAEDSDKLNQESGRPWDVNSLLEKVVMLQEELLQAQEKNLVLSAQTRELERMARDAEDFKAELTAQGLLLADKSRENKLIHQELSRVTSLLDVKLTEVEEVKAQLADIQQQLKMRESERDLLAVMLNEAENAQRRTHQAGETLSRQAAISKTNKDPNSGWPFSFKGKKNNQ